MLAPDSLKRTGEYAMTLIDLLLLLLVAGVCGAIGQAIGGFSRGGCLVSIALGFVGALLGMWLARQAGMPELLPVRVGTQTFPSSGRSSGRRSSSPSSGSSRARAVEPRSVTAR